MPNRPSAFYTIRILDSLLRFVPPLPPFFTERLRDYWQEKLKKSLVPSTGRYYASEMGVLEPVHVLILGEGDRGPGLSAWLPRPMV